MNEQKIDKREFRNALGTFATGVTVITAKHPDGAYVGVTANSFNSVSLDPPLVLWSLAKTSNSLPGFVASDYFAVNVLAADQVTWSNHFATQQDDKFIDVSYENGAGDAPLLDGCAARFQCKKNFIYEGGDHLIIVGEVIKFDNTGRPGLLYHEGHYAVSEAHPVAAAKQAEQSARGGFADDYLDYLLVHASAKFQKNFQLIIDKAGLTRFQWRVLASLSDRDDQDISELGEMTLIPAPQTVEVVQHLERTGLLASRIDEWDANKERYFLTDSGLTRVVGLLAAAKAHEADALGEFNADEARALKEALKRLITWVDTAAEPIVR